MNLNQKVIAALSSLSIDIVANVYNGTSTEYIVFDYSDERPSNWADDEALEDETYLRVHYFTKTNPKTKKDTIRTLMKNAGFIVVSTDELYEDDTSYNHIIVTVLYDGEIEY